MVRSLSQQLLRIASELEALGHVQSDRERLAAELRKLVRLMAGECTEKEAA